MKLKLYDMQVDTTDSGFFGYNFKQRLNALEQRLEEFHSSLSPPEVGTRIQGIFTAPENYFARSNQIGQVRQFEEKEKNQILLRIKQLSDIYKKILIIPGTISWKKPALPEGITLGEGSSSFAPVLYATALDPQRIQQLEQEKRQRGERTDSMYSVESEILRAYEFIEKYGHNAGTSRDWKGAINTKVVKLQNLKPGVRKVLASQIPDELKNTELAYNSAFIYLNGQQLARYDKSSDFQENTTKDKNIYHVTGGFDPIISIPINNSSSFNLGIEICLDHACGVLSQYHRTQSGNFTLLDQTPDIHLILSASVENKVGNICVKNGGYFIHSSSFSGSRRYLQKTDNSFIVLPILNGVELYLPSDPRTLPRQVRSSEIASVLDVVVRNLNLPHFNIWNYITLDQMHVIIPYQNDSVLRMPAFFLSSTIRWLSGIQNQCSLGSERGFITVIETGKPEIKKLNLREVLGITMERAIKDSNCQLLLR